MAWREVKTIKNSKSVRVYTFACVLILTVLLSSMIGIIAAEKPAEPGNPDNKGPKPPPPPPEYWFYIWIGSPGDDVVLVDPEYLTAISYVDSCGWNWPPKKGTRSGGWNVDPHNYYDPAVGCGVYDVNIVSEGYLPALGVEPRTYDIAHHWSSRRVREFGNQPIDFWELRIRWGWDPETQENHRWLRVHTDWGPELEGNYTTSTEGEVLEWTVDFNGALWTLDAFHEDGTGYVVAEGTIVNGFTVKIVKGPEVS